MSHLRLEKGDSHGFCLPCDAHPCPPYFCASNTESASSVPAPNSMKLTFPAIVDLSNYRFKFCIQH